ncbi:MAG: hypothetical protein AW07_02375 [Candidatus Accumulibacter sp. SK-11]|nr:MAG: hypothetical protein AW07_02375 [Candidatus Accumulibacter sp. SK-11]
MELLRHDPARPFGDATLPVYLGECDEAEFGVAGGDELVGLRDALCRDELQPQLLKQTERLQRLDAGCAVGCEPGIGQRKVMEVVPSQHFTLGVHEALSPAPEDEFADSVGEPATGNAVAFPLQACRCLVVSREQHFEGCAGLDLGVELAG